MTYCIITPKTSTLIKDIIDSDNQYGEDLNNEDFIMKQINRNKKIIKSLVKKKKHLMKGLVEPEIISFPIDSDEIDEILKTNRDLTESNESLYVKIDSLTNKIIDIETLIRHLEYLLKMYSEKVTAHRNKFIS